MVKTKTEWVNKENVRPTTTTGYEQNKPDRLRRAFDGTIGKTNVQKQGLGVGLRVGYLGTTPIGQGPLPPQ